MTRSSPVPVGRGGLAAEAAGKGAAGAALAGAGAAGAAVGRARKSSTSPLVIRPSLPLPAPTSTDASFCSVISLAAAGSGACGSAGAGRATGPEGVAGGLMPAEGLAAERGGGALAAADLPAPCSDTMPSTAPTPTSSPSLAMISDSTPAAGAGTSTVTLSVSSSTTGSSRATVSPAFLSQRAIVAEVTLSPSWGTLISVAMSEVQSWVCASRPQN